MQGAGSGGSWVAPADAWYLFATELSTDQLLVYAFTGSPPSIERAVEDVLERVRSNAELRLRARHRNFRLGFPEWVLGEVEQTDVHVSDGLDWWGCLNAFGELTEKQLDPERAVWRLRIFVGVHGVPASSLGQPSTVAVLQISHAFADGTRAAALAGLLFGRNVPLPAVAAPPAERRVSRGIEAIRRRRQLDFEIEAGRVPAPAGPVPALRTNDAATGAPILRTFVRHRTQLPGKSITIGALVAISEALGGYLRERGEDPSTLTALVPMAKPGIPHARNHSGPEYIRLHPDVTARDERAGLIATEFEDCRRRHLHPGFGATELALSTLPLPLLHWVMARRSPPTVMANTVVSSVNRGAADLSFGGCPVFMTAGYPFLTPNIGLTHGVHGLGEMVAISVNTTESIIPDIDHYIDRLTASFRP